MNKNGIQRLLTAVLTIIMLTVSILSSNTSVIEAETDAPNATAEYNAEKGLVVSSETQNWIDKITSININIQDSVSFTFSGTEINKRTGSVYVEVATIVTKQGFVSGNYNITVSSEDYSVWNNNNSTIEIYPFATVTFDPTGGVFPNNEGENYWYESTRKGNALFAFAPDPVKDTYKFNGWKDSNGNHFNPSTVVNENMTVFAQWAANVISVGSLGDVQVSFDNENWSEPGAQRPVSNTEFSGQQTTVYIRTKKTVTENETSKNFWKWKTTGDTNQTGSDTFTDDFVVASFAYRGGSITIVPQYKANDEKTVKYYSQNVTTDENGTVTTGEIQFMAEELAANTYTVNANLNDSNYEYDKLSVFDYTGGTKGNELPLMDENGSHPMGSSYQFNQPSGDRLVVFNYLKKLSDGNHYLFVNSSYTDQCIAKKGGNVVTYAKQGEEIVLSAPETVTFEGQQMTFAYWTGVEMEGSGGRQLTIPNATSHETAVTFGDKKTYYSANYITSEQSTCHIIRETYLDGTKDRENDLGYKVGGLHTVGSQFNDTDVVNGRIYKVKKLVITDKNNFTSEYDLSSKNVSKVGGVQGYYDRYNDNTVIPAGYSTLYIQMFYETRASLGKSKDEILNLVKTSDDISGKTINTVNLDVKNGQLNTDQETAIKNIADAQAAQGKEANIGTVLDLSLVATYNNDTQSAYISELTNPISLSVYLTDEELAQIVDPQDIKVARIHNGTTTLLDATLNGNVLTTASDSFSTYAVVSYGTDNAYAILLSNGDLMFFRSNATYANGSEQTITINSNSYTGRVFANVESAQINEAPWVNYKSSIKKAYVASGYTISPLQMVNWFSGCTNLTNFDFNGFNLTNCTDIGDLFTICSKLETIENFSNIDTSNVTVFENLFNGCSSLPAQTIVNFAAKLNTSKATLLTGMFAGTNIETLNLSNFATTAVTDFSNMFNGCSKLKTLNISSFDTTGATSGSEKMENMFKDCNNLESVTFGANFKKNSNDNLYLRQGSWRLENTLTILTETTLFENANITGQWNYVIPVSVSFNTGTDQTINPKKILVGDTYGNLPCPGCSTDMTEKTGYEFAGWYDAQTGGNKVESTTQVTNTQNHTLFARWNERTYKVSYDANGGTGTMISDSQRLYSEKTDLPTTVEFKKTGYSFDGWTLDDVKVVAVPEKTAKDVTVKAIWKENNYQITYIPNGASGTQPVDTRKYTEEFALPVYGTSAFKLTYKGHRFIGWKLGENTVTEVGPDLAQDVEVTATWEVDALTVTLNNNGTITNISNFPKGYSLAEYYGDTYDEPVKSGYIFKEWNTETDGTGTAYSKDSSINESIILYAIFVKVEIEDPEIGTYADENKQAVADVSKKTQAAETVLAAETSKVIIPDEVSSKVDDQDVLSELGTTKENVEMVIETHLKMDITSVTTDKDDNINKFIIDITPLYTVKAKVKGVDGGKTVPLMKDNNGNIRYEELHVAANTHMKIYLPESFIGDNAKVWVKHKNTVFGGDDGNGLEVKEENNCYYVEYDDPNGFSPFEVSKTRLYPDPEVNPSPSGSSDNKVKLPKTGIE